MSFFLDTHETSERFSTHVAEFCSLLDTNHIRHGSPSDLFEFAKTLENSNQFRLDLSALVKSVVKREHDELLLTDMMSIIASSVGGPSFADTHADMTKPTNALMEFLLGTGCWKQFGSPSPSQNTRPSPRPSPRPAVRTEEPRIVPILPPVSTTSDSPEAQASLLDVSSELRQTLTRLEVSTLEVKQQLDSIERRMGRTEPPPEAPSSRPSSPQDLLLHPKTGDMPANIPADEILQHRGEGIPAMEAELPTRGRAVFSQPHQPDESEDDFSSPTFAYAAETRRSIIPVGIFLVLLVAVAALLFFLHSGQNEALLKASMSRLKTGFSSAPATQEAAINSSSPSVPTSASTTTTPASSPPAISNSTPKGIAGTAPTSSAESNGTNQSIPSDARSAKLRYVPANVMEGNLLSAPRPVYPPLARINHITGQVALQATISRSGSIKTLHAINGPSSLRSAAVDAVRHWHYKPYIVDGRPTEVATTVYVDFSLKPPPTLAH